jgi:hypothetical protein
VSQQQEEGYDMYGIRLFRNESTDASCELLDDFSEGEIEFLDTAKKHYRSIQGMVEDGVRKPALFDNIDVAMVNITIHDDSYSITYAFKPTGELLAIYDIAEEVRTAYTPEGQ